MNHAEKILDGSISDRSVSVWQHEVSYDRCRKLCLFQTRRERAAMMPEFNFADRNSDGMRATGGESRRCAQRTRPRLGNTGASIAQTDRVLSGGPTESTKGYDGIACPDKDTQGNGRF